MLRRVDELEKALTLKTPQPISSFQALCLDAGAPLKHLAPGNLGLIGAILARCSGVPGGGAVARLVLLCLLKATEHSSEAPNRVRQDAPLCRAIVGMAEHPPDGPDEADGASGAAEGTAAGEIGLLLQSAAASTQQLAQDVAGRCSIAC